MKKISKSNPLTPHSTTTRVVIWAALICLSGFLSASAASITYTFTGVGSGRLGNTIFTAAPFTLTASADAPELHIDLFGFIRKITNTTTTVPSADWGRPRLPCRQSP